MIFIKFKNQKNWKNIKRVRGYTLVELLFYVALFALLSFVLVDAIIVMTKAFKETTIQAELDGGGDIMERISREIRKANSISSVSESDLVLNTTDDAEMAKTVRFLLSNSNVQFFENDVLTGNLNSPNVAVTGLTFTQITTGNGIAVRITLIVRSNNDAVNRTANFYNTIVLRGSY